MRGLRKYLVIIVCGFFIVDFGTCIYHGIQFQINGRYIIATIDSIKPKKNEPPDKEVTFLSYSYKNSNYHYEMDGSSFGYLAGQRVFIKISPNGKANDGIEWGLDCLVPDSIQNEPANGYGEEWIKKNFPGCFLVKPLPAHK
jgi:hypothetical protein